MNMELENTAAANGKNSKKILLMFCFKAVLSAMR